MTVNEVMMESKSCFDCIHCKGDGGSWLCSFKDSYIYNSSDALYCIHYELRDEIYYDIFV